MLNANEIAGSNRVRQPRTAGRRRLHGMITLAAAAVLNNLWFGAADSLAANGIQVENVAAGQASIARDGSITTIRAADKTIINYRQFDVMKNETVRFVQPSETARLLNRIHSVTPSRIDGAIHANGQVYFVNPAGVVFGKNAVVDASRVFAAGGMISDRDFLAGRDRFDLTGSVINQGKIIAHEAALLGSSVQNTGSINARNYTVFAAGDNVYMKPVQGGVVVNITTANASRGGAFGSGDAVGSTLLSGKVVSPTVRAISAGTTTVSANIDATNSNAGATGGSVHITGERVAIQGATIDASGHSGGGEILVGGGPRGDSSLQNATNTIVDSGSTLRADATNAGTGGTVIVWADNATGFSGTISARGKTAGGFAEVSGSNRLVQKGTYDLTSDAGRNGTLLFDPVDIIITGGTADGSDNPDASSASLDNGTLGQILFADVGAADPFVIFESEIEGTDADIILEAERSITVSGTFLDDIVTLQNNRSLTLRTRNDAADPALGVGDAAIDLMNGATPIRFVTSGTGSIIIEAGTGAAPQADLNISLGGLTTATQNITVVSTTGDITLNDTILGADVVRLQGADISQAAGATITANTLGVNASGSVALNEANNVTGFAGSSGAGGLSYLDADDVSVTAVTSSGLFSSNVTGVGSAGDAALTSTAGAITIDEPVVVAGTLRLQAADEVVQNAGDTISAATLGVRAGGEVNLPEANEVTAVALSAGAVGLTYTDLDGFSTTAVTSGGIFGTTVTGIVSNNLPILLNAGDSVVLNQPINAGTGNVGIELAAGSLTQAAAGSITANILGVRAAGAINLSTSGASALGDTNDVNNFAGFSVNGGVDFSDADGFDVGELTAAEVPGLSATITGVTSTGAATRVNLVAITGDLEIDEAVTNAGGVIGLRAVGGSISQSAGNVITGFALGANAAGNISLLEANNVGVFAATSAGGSISYRDADAFTVGSVTAQNDTAALGGITLGNQPLLLINNAGSITIDANITAGTASGIIRINSATDITQNAGTTITGNSLGIRANGTVTLGSTTVANNVGTFAALNTAAAGSVTFVSSAANGLTIGTASNITGFGGAVTGITTSNGAVTIASNATTATGLTVSQAINAGTATVRLEAGGGAILQGASGLITAAALGARAAGSVRVDSAGVDVATIDVRTTGGVNVFDSVLFINQQSTPGSVADSGPFDLVAAGSPAIRSRRFAGNYVVGSEGNLAGGTLLFEAGGTITQSAPITATNLAVRAGSSVTLANASNAVSGTFSAAADSTVRFNNTATTTLGQQAATLAFTAATDGVVTSNDDILLTSNSGIVLARPLNAGTADIGLEAGTTVTQSSGGAVTANAFGVVATGGIAMGSSTGAINAVTAFAGSSSTGPIAFFDPSGFVVSAVTNVNVAGFSGATGISATNQDITLAATTGSIAIAQPINAGTGDVRLRSITGSIASTTFSGHITADELGVSAGNYVTLDQANDINTVAIFAGGSLGMAFTDVNDFTVGTVTASGDFVSAVSGLTTSNARMLLTAAGEAIFAQPVNAGTGNVGLVGGEFTQTATGGITASGLGITATGDVELGLDTGATNTVGTFAASNSGGVIFFRNAQALTIEEISGLEVTGFAGVSGVSTSNFDISISTAAGALTVTRPIDSGTADTRLTAATALSQSGTGTITADSLGVRAGTTVGLALGNAVNTFASSSAGPTRFNNTAGSMSVGQVAGTDEFTLTTGVSTANSSILIESSGDISIDQPLNAGTGNIGINGGAISQTVPGIITADRLGILATGNITLDQSTGDANDVNIFAADSAAGSIAYTDADDLIIEEVIGLDVPNFGGVVGLTANSNPITIVTASGIGIERDVNAGAGIVRLGGGSGRISQGLGATIVAGSLGVSTTDDAILRPTAGNTVGIFAAQVDRGVTFVNTSTLQIGAVSAAGDFPAVQGVTTLNSPALIVNQTGDLDIAQPIDVGTLVGESILRIGSGGAVNQSSGSAVVTAASLAVVADAGIFLDAAPNVIGTFAGVSNGTETEIAVLSGQAADFEIGEVPGLEDGPLFLDDVVGVTTNNGNITLSSSNGNLLINRPITINSGSTAVARLEAEGASISQGAGGLITTPTLGLRVNDSVDLCVAGIDVGSLDVSTAGTAGTVDAILFVNQIPTLSLGVADSGIYDLATAGAFETRIRSFAGDYDITALEGAALQANGTLLIRATGNITQSASLVTGTLGLFSGGSITLDNASNAITNVSSTSVGPTSIVSSSALTVTQIPSQLCFTTAVDGIRTTDSPIFLNSGGAITISRPISAGIGAIGLMAGGAVAQAGPGAITGSALGVRTTSGAILLDSATDDANNVDTFAATAVGIVRFTDADSLAVGVVSNADVPGFTTTTGVTTDGSDITLVVRDGSLSITEIVSNGTTAGDVRLQATGGEITQSGSGVITTNALGVIADGNINLPLNNQVITFAADSAAGTVVYRDVDDFTVGSVDLENDFDDESNILPPALVSPTAVVGVETRNATLTLLSNAGSITLDQLVAAGTSIVRLNTPAGGVTQSATGTITAGSLALLAAGDVLLEKANDVPIVALSNGAFDSRFRSVAGSGLAVGNVTAQTGLAAAVSGAQSAGDILITADFGNLTIARPVNSPTGTVRLESQGGTLTQTLTGRITGNVVGLRALNDVFLDINSGGTVAGVDAQSIEVGAGNDDSIFFVNQVPTPTASDLSLGSYDLAIGTPLRRVRRIDGDYTITGAESLADGIVLIQASGDITQSARIRASTLGLAAGGQITLNSANNRVGTLAATGPDGISYRDADGLALGEISNDVGATTTPFRIFDTEVEGLTAADADITVATGDALAINTLVNAGTGIVRLASGAGISQLAPVTGSSLGVNAAGDVNLNHASNAFATLAVANSAAGDFITICNTIAMNIADVAADGGGLFTATSGVVATNGNVTLATTSGTLDIDAPLTGSTVRLQSPGDISQTGPGVITADTLGVISQTGRVNLDDATGENAVTNFAGSAAGFLQFTSNTDLTVVDVAAADCFDGVTGITGANATLVSGGTLTINQPLNAAGGQVLLQAVGNITQSSAGTITSNALGINSGADIVLNAANDTNLLAAVFGTLQYTDVDDATISSVIGIDDFATAIGGMTGNSAIYNMGGALTVSSPLTVNTITLDTNDNDFTATGSAVITADSLIVAVADVGLGNTAHAISQFSGTAGDVTLNNGNNALAINGLSAGQANLTAGNLVIGNTLTASGLSINAVSLTSNALIHSILAQGGNPRPAAQPLIVQTTGDIQLNQNVDWFGSVTLGSPTQVIVATVNSNGPQRYETNSLFVSGVLSTTTRQGVGGTQANPERPTIILGRQLGDDVTITVGAGGFAVGSATVGEGTQTIEKILAPFGSLTINASGRSVGIGDITALGDILITADSITVFNRPRDGVIDQPVALGGPRTTGRTDFVAGGDIQFTANTLAFDGPEFQQPFFAANNPSSAVDPFGRAFQIQSPPLEFTQLLSNSVFFDAIAFGNTAIDISAAIAALAEFEAPPVRSDSGLLPDDLERLRRATSLNVQRVLPEEISQEADYVGVFMSWVERSAESTQETDFVLETVDRRLFRQAVSELIAANESFSQDKQVEIKRSLEEAIDRFNASRNRTDLGVPREEIPALRTMILTDPELAGTRDMIFELQVYINRIEQLGLTKAEMYGLGTPEFPGALRSLLGAAVPDGMSIDEFLLLVTGKSE